MGERVDYALFSNDVPVLFIEAKAYAANLSNHCPQLSRYYNATPEVAVAAITNGQEWRFFTDLDNRNIMDRDPFLVVNFLAEIEDAADQLERFHYDRLEPDALRALAEENIYLHAFKDTITSALQDCNTDFVRYVAQQSGVQRQLNAKFLDTIQPLVKQAIAQSISAMVATSLTAKEALPAPAAQPIEPNQDVDSPIVDSSNPNIVTTVEEQNFYKICCDILPGEDLQMRDTESYFSIVVGGKSTRWLIRFWGDKRQPAVQFILPLTDEHRAEVSRAGLQVGTNNQILLDKPENLYRLVGIISDALNYCKSDDNFRRKGKDTA